jgi:hypothetical protein
MKPLLLLLLLVIPPVLAKPLIVVNDAWRATALADLAPMLRACVPPADQTTAPALPVFKGDGADLDTRQLIQEPASLGRGYWYRIGWSAKDGTVYVVALRSPDGQRLVFGPVNESWRCLPADVRKELGGK